MSRSEEISHDADEPLYEVERFTGKKRELFTPRLGYALGEAPKIGVVDDDDVWVDILGTLLLRNGFNPLGLRVNYYGRQVASGIQTERTIARYLSGERRIEAVVMDSDLGWGIESPALAYELTQSGIHVIVLTGAGVEASDIYGDCSVAQLDKGYFERESEDPIKVISASLGLRLKD